MLLPDEVPALKEARELITRKRAAFIEQGSAALPEIMDINVRLQAMQKAAVKDFPLNEAEAATLCETWAAQVLKIHDLEQEAVECLQSVMA
jgi:hypothetical protein